MDKALLWGLPAEDERFQRKREPIFPVVPNLPHAGIYLPYPFSSLNRLQHCQFRDDDSGKKRAESNWRVTYFSYKVMEVILLWIKKKKSVLSGPNKRV